MPTTPTISEALKAAVAARHAAGESLYAIAGAAGIPEPSLNRFVNGVRGLSLESADKLAAYLGLALQPVNGGKVGAGARPKRVAGGKRKARE